MSGNSSNENDIPTPRKSQMNINRGLIGTIHVSTTTVYFTVYTIPNFRELLTVREEIQLLMPRDGWFEQDPVEIMTAIYQCCSEACEELSVKGFHCEDVLCIGITNQRETTVMWDTLTGKPLYPAIVWNDIRTVDLVNRLTAKFNAEQIKFLQTVSGLRLSPYFSALKIQWMQKNVREVSEAIKKGNCKAGTLDSWIIWNLTNGNMHVTDVTNASRTLLMNIQTLNWEPALLDIFDVDPDILPKIRSCSEIFGRIYNSRVAFKEVFICGVIGDQQAALVGQSCLDRGQTNCTYDLGCFVLFNTGLQRFYSTHGLLTTVAYKMGPNASPVYALEGSVAVGGHVFDWLTRKMRILPNLDEAEKYAQAVNSSAGVFFVPAFTGLYTPYWRKDARGIIVGLTAMHNAKHIVRAAHEAIAYQVRDVLESIRKDCGVRVLKLRANGNLCQNKTLMQIQADIAGVPITASERNDRATLGAAYCAAHAYSIDLSAVALSKTQTSTPFFNEYGPTVSTVECNVAYAKWQRAIQRSMGWAELKKKEAANAWFWVLTLFVLLAAVTFYYVKRYIYNNYLHIADHIENITKVDIIPVPVSKEHNGRPRYKLPFTW